MSTFNYPFDKLYGPGTTCSIDLVAGTTYTFDITNNTGSSYFVLETVRDYNGVTPKNLSGSLTNFSNIAYHVADDYKAGFVLPTSTNSFDFTPANNVVKETLMFRGTGGIILGTGSAPSPPVTASFRIDTTQTTVGSTANNIFQLPLTNNGVINFDIDWGDGTINTINTWNQPEVTHTYPSPGTYDVAITSGVIRGWSFGGSGDRNKLMEVYDWSVWDFNVDSAFRGCNNLVSSTTSVPIITSTSLNSMFSRAYQFNGSIGNWNVSGVNNMQLLFFSASAFDQDISSWDISNVTNMGGMFDNAASFDQNLGSWDVSLVTNFNDFMKNKTPLTFSPLNLDAIYNGWSALPSLQSNVTASFGTANYTAAGAAGRNILVTTYNWLITDGGQV
jgi:surface protein